MGAARRRTFLPSRSDFDMSPTDFFAIEMVLARAVRGARTAQRVCDGANAEADARSARARARTFMMSVGTDGSVSGKRLGVLGSLDASHLIQLDYA
jgi:hypothetical protein